MTSSPIAFEATSIDRIAFFGTPAFAVPTLNALESAGRRPVVVVSQPTRRVGRGRRPQPPPVAEWAEEHEVELVQTANVREAEVMDRLRAADLDLAIVVAFGQIFRRPLLELPRLGCMNLHASLLPAYRGASPVVAAIRAGETVTGASTMCMERGLDSGPVLLQRELEIGPNETAGALAPRLAEIGGELVVETLARWERGALSAHPQDEARVSLAPMLDRDEGWIDWAAPAQRIHDLVRAFDPWPGTRTRLGGDVVAVKQTRVAAPETDGGASTQSAPGTICAVVGDSLLVRAGDRRLLEVERVQKAGRRAVSGRDFANAEADLIGRRFEAPAGAH